MIGGSLAGQQIIEGAFCPCRAWVHVARERAASTSCLVGAFDNALGGAFSSAGIRWQAAHAHRLRYCMVDSDDARKRKTAIPPHRKNAQLAAKKRRRGGPKHAMAAAPCSPSIGLCGRQSGKTSCHLDCSRPTPRSLPSVPWCGGAMCVRRTSCLIMWPNTSLRLRVAFCRSFLRLLSALLVAIREFKIPETLR
jgi:hypothetical protein